MWDSISQPCDRDLRGRPILKGLSPPGAAPQIIPEKHHQCADGYILDVRLDVENSSVWAWPRPTIEVQKDRRIAKVSLPIFPQRNKHCFLGFFHQIQVKIR